MNPVVLPDEIPFAAFLGLDWADQKHSGACCAPGGPVEAFELEQTPEAIDRWVAGLQSRFPGGRFAVCLEQSKGALS